MRFVKLGFEGCDLELLKLFVENAGSSLRTFRYFRTRPLEVIKNHLCTFLLLDGDIPTAYGHLDIDDLNVWLGIAVSEKYTGKGLGKLMLAHLIDFAKQNKVKKIRLSVDNYNEIAKKLYTNHGFVKEDCDPSKAVWFYSKGLESEDF